MPVHMLDQGALAAGLAADLVGEVEGVALQLQAVAGQALQGVDFLVDLLGGLALLVAGGGDLAAAAGDLADAQGDVRQGLGGGVDLFDAGPRLLQAPAAWP